jgi:hypothetical protein
VLYPIIKSVKINLIRISPNLSVTSIYITSLYIVTTLHVTLIAKSTNLVVMSIYLMTLLYRNYFLGDIDWHYTQMGRCGHKFHDFVYCNYSLDDIESWDLTQIRRCGNHCHTGSSCNIQSGDTDVHISQPESGVNHCHTGSSYNIQSHDTDVHISQPESGVNPWHADSSYNLQSHDIYSHQIHIGRYGHQCHSETKIMVTFHNYTWDPDSHLSSICQGHNWHTWLQKQSKWH